MKERCFRCLTETAEHVALEKRREIPVCSSCLRDDDKLWLDEPGAVAIVDRGCST